MNLTGKALAILMTLVLGLAVVACGSDSDSDSNSTGDTAAQTTDSSAGDGTGTDDSGSGESDGIEGVTWSLMNIAVQGSASSLPSSVDPPTLLFEDGEVQIFSGCNSGSGTAEITDDVIEFGPIAMTEKGCGQLESEIEQYVAFGTQGDVAYEASQGNLVLEGKKQVSLVFTQE